MIRPMCDRCTWDFLYHRKEFVTVKQLSIRLSYDRKIVWALVGKVLCPGERTGRSKVCKPLMSEGVGEVKWACPLCSLIGKTVLL